jgi:hypothetical protein
LIEINYSFKPASELPLGTEDEDHDEISEEEKQEEPALHFEDIYFDVPCNNLGNGSEPLYQRNRRRVVRFLQDEEDPNEESMMMGGLAAAGGMAAAGILASKVNDALQESDASMYMLDVFDEGGAGGNNNGTNSSQNLDASGNSMIETDEDDHSLDEAEEQEKQIRKTLLMTMFGIGFMGLVGFGTKQLMRILCRGKDQDLGAGDIVGDGIDTATHAADGGPSSQVTAQASLNASANASSQSSSKAFAMFGVGNNPAAVTGAQ